MRDETPLSPQEIREMREELARITTPAIDPKWDVFRIVSTIEALRNEREDALRIGYDTILQQTCEGHEHDANEARELAVDLWNFFADHICPIDSREAYKQELWQRVRALGAVKR